MKENTSTRLKQIMKERNLRQIDIINLAKPYCQFYKVKLGRNDMSQYLSGKIEPKQNKIYILSKALDVDEAWLMGYDVPRERKENEDNSIHSSILSKYNKLNSNGQIKAESYIDGLLENPDYVKKEKVKTTENTEGLVIVVILNDTELNMVANIGVSEPPKVKKKRKHT